MARTSSKPTDPRKDNGWRPEDIKAAIRKTGTTLSKLSLQAGLGESTVRQALLFPSCPSGEKAIIKCLGLPPHELWPRRYDKNGNRIVGHGSKTTKKRSSRHCQKSEAA